MMRSNSMRSGRWISLLDVKYAFSVKKTQVFSLFRHKSPNYFLIFRIYSGITVILRRQITAHIQN